MHSWFFTLFFLLCLSSTVLAESPSQLPAPETRTSELDERDLEAVTELLELPAGALYVEISRAPKREVEESTQLARAEGAQFTKLVRELLSIKKQLRDKRLSSPERLSLRARSALLRAQGLELLRRVIVLAATTERVGLGNASLQHMFWLLGAPLALLVGGPKLQALGVPFELAQSASTFGGVMLFTAPFFLAVQSWRSDLDPLNTRHPVLDAFKAAIDGQVAFSYWRPLSSICERYFSENR